MYRTHFHRAEVMWSGLEGNAKILEGTPLIIDEDLKFEDSGTGRDTWVINSWLIARSHDPNISPRTLDVYLDALLPWLCFLVTIEVDLLGNRTALKAALGLYAEHRLSGHHRKRWANSTWNLHVTAISEFYKWARDEHLTDATPFSYSEIRVLRNELPIVVLRNNAKLPSPKGHSRIKYLGADYQTVLLNTLEGLTPDGSKPFPTKGRNLTRNAVLARLMIAAGLRRQELAFITSYELPRLPKENTEMPVDFFLPGSITKGGKARTTWVDFDTLTQVHEYLRWDRDIAARKSAWAPKPSTGSALHVESPDAMGARIEGELRSWSDVTLNERARLVAPEGGSCLLGLCSTGAPFRAFETILRRVSARITREMDERFPHVHPHMLRHTFAMNTLELLVRGFYDAVARTSSQTNQNPAVALYMTQQDPIMVLRDLLGHSTVTTTQLYLDRLDTRRIYADAWDSAELRAHTPSQSILDEVEREFSEGDR